MQGTTATLPVKAVVRSNYLPVYYPGTQRLMFRYDATRAIIELQERSVKYYVDLAELQVTLSPPDPAR